MSRPVNRGQRPPADAGTRAVPFVPESALSAARRRTRFDAPAGDVRFGGRREGVMNVLAYALPPEPWKNDYEPLVFECDDLDLHSLPLGDSDSFLSYDAVVVFAGAFEHVWMNDQGFQRVSCFNHDLDKREREYHTMIGGNKPLILLLPELPEHHDFRSDLFRRIFARLPMPWYTLKGGLPSIKAEVIEFQPFIERHGFARVYFRHELPSVPSPTVIAGAKDEIYALCYDLTLFILPCVAPMTRPEAAQAAAEAARCVFAYRQRLTRELPAWVREFQFARERELGQRLDALRREVTTVEQHLAPYTVCKGALCHRSGPLVEVVVEILRSALKLRVQVDDQKVEDARILADDESVLSVVEIKADGTSFKRAHINQVDDHRERLGLSRSTPGLLVMNTMTKATTLSEKDEPPHGDIIEKAVAENVVLVRTLDLLRIVDLVEQGKVGAEDARGRLLTGFGWLTVRDDKLEVVTR